MKPLPKSYKSLWRYFTEISETAEFISEIKEVRSKYDLPIGGYKNNKIAYKDLNLKEKSNPYIWELIDNSAFKLAIDYGFNPSIWHDIFFDCFLTDGVKDVSIFEIANSIGEIEGPGQDNDIDNSIFPVRIKLSAYASENEIVEFIKRNFKQKIKPIQDREKSENIKIGSLRTRNSLIKKRNDIIYKNRKRKYEDIIKILSSEGLTKGKLLIDYSYMQKIIKEEIKKRK